MYIDRGRRLTACHLEVFIIYLICSYSEFTATFSVLLGVLLDMSHMQAVVAYTVESLCVLIPARIFIS